MAILCRKPLIFSLKNIQFFLSLPNHLEFSFSVDNIVAIADTSFGRTAVIIHSADGYNHYVPKIFQNVAPN